MAVGFSGSGTTISGLRVSFPDGLNRASESRPRLNWAFSAEKAETAEGREAKRKTKFNIAIAIEFVSYVDFKQRNMSDQESRPCSQQRIAYRMFKVSGDEGKTFQQKSRLR
jgi:hypothetical protein